MEKTRPILYGVADYAELCHGGGFFKQFFSMPLQDGHATGCDFLHR